MHQNHPTKVRVAKTAESTPQQTASAERNRDAFSLLSEADRHQFARQYAVVVRTGSEVGLVIGHGASMDSAVRMAQQNPTYKATNCAVRYIPASDDDVFSN